MQKYRSFAAAAALVLVVGCAANDPNRGAKTGAVVGAIVGAVIGNQGSSDTQRYAGAAVGALAGGAVGSYMDRQRQDLENSLADEQRRDELDITEVGDNALKIGIASDATFEFDSADIQPQYRPTYRKIADVLREYEQTIVHIIGHTDSTGPADYNMRLSERRAESVGLYLRDRGVQGDRLIYDGRGETESVASNETEEGRRQNRRVEIVIKPIVEGEEREAYTPPPRT
ncbi:OmpA family protein [Halofilum ochraceum]|uniref:OmpA family protein n=1 Tax=Halofilum ochraceum TaxID=1611323 RepID=UPI000831620A|nr:OmpA family protein [Halofilum ochraceum]